MKFGILKGRLATNMKVILNCSNQESDCFSEESSRYVIVPERKLQHRASLGKSRKYCRLTNVTNGCFPPFQSAASSRETLSRLDALRYELAGLMNLPQVQHLDLLNHSRNSPGLISGWSCRISYKRTFHA
jgi:hypothetical protein